MPDWDHLFNKSRLKTLITLFKHVWTKLNEIVLNIDTMAEKTVFNAHSCEISPYESPDYWYLRKISGMLGQYANNNEIFYDLGSGMGRILCVMAQKPFKRVVGIELKEDLCQIAQQNADRLRGKQAPIKVVCADAARADLSDGTIYFMFHPFGAETLQAVCENLKNSLAANPRHIIIIYYNAVHEHVLLSAEWLEIYNYFNTLTGRRISFWRNRGVENLSISGNTI